MNCNDNSQPLDVEKLKAQFQQCWSSDSSSRWTPENPSRGQCNVTTLVIQDHYGGEILKTPVDGQWHFYNRIADQVVDLTAEQFAILPNYLDLPSNRNESLAGTTAKRYAALSRRFNQVREQA